MDALREGERSGRPATLDLAQWRKPQVLAELLRRRNGVKLGVHQYQRLFRRMGFRLRKPSPQVAQADPLKIAAVKKLRRLVRRADVEVWSLDECPFQQHGTRCRMWVPPEIKDRPCCMHRPANPSPASEQST